MQLLESWLKYQKKFDSVAELAMAFVESSQQPSGSPAQSLQNKNQQRVVQHVGQRHLDDRLERDGSGRS